MVFKERLTLDWGVCPFDVADDCAMIDKNT